MEEYDCKLKDVEENEGDSEILELLRNKVMYFVRIGDKVCLCLVVWWVELLIEMIGIVGVSVVGFGDCDWKDGRVGSKDWFCFGYCVNWIVFFWYLFCYY